MFLGVGSLAYFSEDEDTGESSNQEEEESDGAESDEHEGDDMAMMDEQLERRSNPGKILTFSLASELLVLL